MRLLAAVALVLAYIAFTAFVLRAHRRRRASSAAMSDGSPTTADGSPLLVAFASQTGFAEQLAQHTAQSLKTAGIATAVEALAALDIPRLAKASRALFVVSTTGEGDAPDSAANFTRRVMPDPTSLPQLEYGLLALGDREYKNYCGFGRELDRWLRQRGAQPLFEPVEVDDGDERALHSWREHLNALAGETLTYRAHAPVFERWRLADRVLANPGSAGSPTFYLSFEPTGATAQWQAGDIAEIRPHHPVARVAAFLEAAGLDGREQVHVDDRTLTLAEVVARSVLAETPGTGNPQQLAQSLTPLSKRDFSIASLPADGRLDLLVRQARFENGELGIGTGWLTEHAWIGAEIELRIRDNPGFHAPPDDRPLILIGNGTGMAGLRSLLRSQSVQARRRNWLIFGERNVVHDFYYRGEIEAWRAQGVIARLDLAFSRDQHERIYVQHRLLAARDGLRAWVDDGAAVYVCGSIDGMACGVESALIEVIGKDGLDRLLDTGRYHRDVY